MPTAPWRALHGRCPDIQNFLDRRAAIGTAKPFGQLHPVIQNTVGQVQEVVDKHLPLFTFPLDDGGFEFQRTHASRANVAESIYRAELVDTATARRQPGVD